MSNERAKFEEWCPIKITNEAKAPKAVALKRAYWTSWQARAEIAESERQASRVVALAEEDRCGNCDHHSDLHDEECTVYIQTRNGVSVKCACQWNSSQSGSIRSLAEAPTKEK